MHPHEIFALASPERTSQIFSFLYEKEKPLYKATVEALAKKRNLRPIFVERKPRNERFAWMRDALSRPMNDGAAAHLLQVWLVKEHPALLCDFLDALGIAHEENGTVDELPSAPPVEKIEGAIDALFAKHEPDLVTLYLRTFQALHESGGWPALEERLAADPRLALTPV